MGDTRRAVVIAGHEVREAADGSRFRSVRQERATRITRTAKRIERVDRMAERQELCRSPDVTLRLAELEG